ncbi:MAG: carboxypeptidase-like regulatory domain-containing protein, partial [Prevotellaceae bacterium]|nr:carboxypeptidase-like regulatory domain-containing protein [Prevotellaceae bacterium]
MTNILQKTFILFAFIFCTLSVSSEEKSLVNIQGFIKSKSGEPLDYVSVYIKGTHYVSFSDSNGKFGSVRKPGFPFDHYAHSVDNLNKKNGISETPLNCLLKAFT